MPKHDYSSYRRDLIRIPGWFAGTDPELFEICSSIQQSNGIGGDLLEIGAYEGRSAILLGFMASEPERLWVCDLFGDPAPSSQNVAENRTTYSGLARDTFEANYLQYHATLPEILQMPSAQIEPLLQPGTFRFAHIDGSHHIDAVRADLALSRRLLQPGGIVAVDDFRSAHTQDVAAAAWEAILSRDLRPFALSGAKLYATWAETGAEMPAAYRSAISGTVALLTENRSLFDEPLVVVYESRTRGRHPVLRQVVPPVLARLAVSARDKLNTRFRPPT